MHTSQKSNAKRKARIGWYSELTRDKAFEASSDTHLPQARRIYALLLVSGKLTRWQIARQLDIPMHVVCARVNGLMKDELVIDTKEEVIDEITETPNNLVEAVVKEPELFPA